MSYSNSNNNSRGGASQSQSKNPHTDGPVPASRTLFIRNVQFDATKDIVIEKLEPYGDIKDTFDLIAKRGLIFVTFVSSPFNCQRLSLYLFAFLNNLLYAPS